MLTASFIISIILLVMLFGKADIEAVKLFTLALSVLSIITFFVK